MEIFVKRENVDDLDHLYAQFEAIKEEIERERQNCGNSDRLKELQESRDRIGFRIFWLTKPV